MTKMPARFGMLLLLMLLLPATARGAAFRIPEISIAGLGTSNAMVANPDEIGAIAYNPAAMSYHDEIMIAAGLSLASPDLSVTTSAGEFESDTDDPLLPNLIVGGLISKRVGLGLLVNTPFGLETNWPLGTFPQLAGAMGGILQTTQTKLEMLNINPNVSVKLGRTSIAAGLSYYTVLDSNFDTQSIKISGDGEDAGYNLAFMHAQDAWSVGISYRSRVTTSLSGTLETNPPGLPNSSAPGSLEVTFPDMLQVGFRYVVREKVGIEVDFERTGWSSFKQLVAVHQNPVVPSPIVSTNDWTDSNAYRAGVTWQVSGPTQLRFGYTYDETPQGDDHFSARIPDNDRQLLSIGIGHAFGRWAIEAGYLYVRFKDRSIESTVPFGTYGTDPNGTTAYNGMYNSNVSLFGIGFNVKL